VLNWKTVRGDLFGASAAAVITIPLCIAYGLIAFAPLGSGFATQAAFIGILSAFFTCLAASLFGSTRALITAPTAALTLVISSVIGYLAVHPLLADIPSREAVIIGLMSLSVFTGGAVQLIFATFRFGNLVKYVPYPVMAGFMNGIAVLLILKQIRPLIGVKSKTPLLKIVLHPGIIEPLTCLVGVATLVMILLFSRWLKAIPGSLIGLLGGTALYYGIRHFSGPANIGPTVGKIDIQFVKPLVFDGFIEQMTLLNPAPLIPTLLIAGVMIGLVGSMESLLSAVVADDLTGSRHNSNKELLGQGAGNTLSALFGCLPGAGSIPKTLDNFRAGGRTRLSGVLASFIILILMVFLGPYIGMIPLTVFAAIVVAIGIEMVDEWSIHLLRQLPKAGPHRKTIIGNLSVAFAVTIIMVSVNLVMAIGIGIVIASILFISKMGKSSVRRKFFGHQIRSKKVRSWEDTKVLDSLGKKIVVFELHGPIFFGSGDNLVKEIHESMDGTSYCILDLKRVNEIDSTGAKSIIRASRSLQKENKKLLISYLHEGRTLREFLTVFGFEQEFGEDRIFPDTDTALEMAENELLRSEGLKVETEEIELGRVDVLMDFTEAEVHSLKDRLVRKEYQVDEKVIGTQEVSRDLFFLTHGSVSIRISLSGKGQTKRLATYSAGAIFGEMAFLDGAPRSAEVTCDEKSVVYSITYNEFESLSRKEPELALKLIKSIAIEITRRLRTTSMEIGFLEEH
jgi:SulP family sulfate permease